VLALVAGVTAVGLIVWGIGKLRRIK
jgi:hypothetical protein